MIRWNVLDPTSKILAATDKVSGMTYKLMYEWIDLRYKVSFGNLEYRPASKDDPMGLALVGEAPQEQPPGLEPQAV